MTFEFNPDQHDLLICPVCANWDIEATAWIHANTHELVDKEGPSEICWCPTCNEHVAQIYTHEATPATRGRLMDNLSGFTLALHRKSPDNAAATVAHLLGIWHQTPMSQEHVAGLLEEWLRQQTTE